MDVQTEIKPWSSLDEWQYVKNCLLQKKLGHALEYIDLWKMRTHKLDGGKFEFLKKSCQSLSDRE